MNQYLENQQSEAFVHRQIIVNPKFVTPANRDVDLKQKLKESAGSFGVWITTTPHVLCYIFDYSIVLNYCCKSWE